MTTQLELSYGFRTPKDILEKMVRERTRFASPPDRDQIFNFMITAHSMRDWTSKAFASEIEIAGFGLGKNGIWILHPCSAQYIVSPDDAGMIPNPPETEICRYVLDSLMLCQNIANTSKHYLWREEVEGISEEPQIADFYQYFFTGVEKDIYVTIEKRHYGVAQIASILIQFYTGLLSDLEKVQQDD